MAKIYKYHSSTLNPFFSSGLTAVEDHRPLTNKERIKREKMLNRHKPKGKFRDGRFDPCLKANNSENEQSKLMVKRQPKHFTCFRVRDVNEETGEIDPLGTTHTTNDLKQAKHRRIKAIKKFGEFYDPLYKAKEVTLLFLTFTRMNYAKLSFARMMDNVRYHIEKQLGICLRGFIWVLEASQRDHLHYHLCLAIDRLNASKMPKELKFEGIWGQRTQVTFVKKSVIGYMMKYLTKEEAVIMGCRSYGKSRTYK